MTKLVILGGHTPVGEALHEALQDRGVEADVVRATTLEYLRSPLVLFDEDTLDGAALVFLAFDSELTRALADGASRLKAPVVDLVGILPQTAPLVFPILDREPGAPLLGAIRIPLGLVGPTVAILRAVGPYRPSAARVVTFEGVAGAGQPGLDALSEETRAVFTGQTPDSSPFDGPIAFAVTTSLGSDSDPFGPDEAFADDVRAGLEDPMDLSVTRTRVPVFTGEGAAVSVQLAAPPAGAEKVTQLLSKSRGLRAAKSPSPGTLQAVDRDDALFGRVRLSGSQLDLWIAADRLRHGAAASAALLAEARMTRSSPS